MNKITTYTITIEENESIYELTAYRLSEGYPIDFNLIDSIEYRKANLLMQDVHTYHAQIKNVTVATCHYINTRTGSYVTHLIIDEDSLSCIEEFKRIDKLLRS